MLRFDIKGLQYKCVMKQTSLRLRWTMVIANAGFTWLRGIFDERTLRKPLELLESVKETIPVIQPGYLHLLLRKSSLGWIQKSYPKNDENNEDLQVHVDT